MNTECLKIRGLKVVFYSGEGFIKAVEGYPIQAEWKRLIDDAEQSECC